MGRTFTEAALSDTVSLTLYRYRDLSTNTLKVDAKVAFAVVDATGKILDQSTKDNLFVQLPLAAQTVLTDAMQRIVTKLAAELEIARNL